VGVGGSLIQHACPKEEEEGGGAVVGICLADLQRGEWMGCVLGVGSGVGSKGCGRRG
jgi:hypothetical protein